MATIKEFAIDSRKRSWFSSPYTAVILSEHDGVLDSLGTCTWPIAVLTEEIRINAHHYYPKLALQHIWKAFGFSLLFIVSTCSLTNNWQVFLPCALGCDGIKSRERSRDRHFRVWAEEAVRKLCCIWLHCNWCNWWEQKSCVNRIWHPQDRPEVLPMGWGGDRLLY